MKKELLKEKLESLKGKLETLKDLKFKNTAKNYSRNHTCTFLVYAYV